MFKTVRSIFVNILLLLLLISGPGVWPGCGGKVAIRYYMLEPMRPSPQETALVSDHDETILIGVGPITVAEYLQRTEIIIRNHRRQLILADDHQWAEPLEATVMRVMTANLSHLLKGDGTTVLPWRDMSALDYQIKLELIRLDSEQADNAVLEARWMLLKGSERNVIGIHTVRLEEKLPFNPDETENYHAIVAAESRLLEQLSREMADGVRYRLDNR
jgi:hypothetical protein